MDTTREYTGQLEAEIRELKAQLIQLREIARQNECALASEKECLQASCPRLCEYNFPNGTLFRFQSEVEPVDDTALMEALRKVLN